MAWDDGQPGDTKFDKDKGSEQDDADNVENNYDGRGPGKDGATPVGGDLHGGGARRKVEIKIHIKMQR